MKYVQKVCDSCGHRRAPLHPYIDGADAWLLCDECMIPGTKITLSCVHARYWGGNNPDRFYLVVDVAQNGKTDTYLYNSLEG